MIRKFNIVLFFLLSGGAIIQIGWNTYFYILFMVILAGSFMLGTKPIRVSAATLKNLLLLFVVFVLLILARGESLDFGDDTNIIIKFFILFVFSVYVTTYYPSDRAFFTNMVTVFEFLLVLSLLTFVIVNVAPSILVQVGYKNVVRDQQFQTFLGIAFTRPNDYQKYGFFRNQGVFWEPGVYAVMLISVYMIKYLYLGQRKRLWLYYVCIISSASMGGVLIFTVFNLCRPIFSGSKEQVRQKLPAAAIFIGIPLFVLIDLFYYFSSDIITGLGVLFHRNLTDDSSLNTRYQDFYYGFLAAENKLITGHGQDFTDFYVTTKQALNTSKSAYEGGITNSIISMLYCYGLIFLVVYIILMFKSSIQISARYALLIFFTMIAMLMLEPLSVSVFMLFIITFRNDKRIKLV